MAFWLIRKLRFVAAIAGVVGLVGCASLPGGSDDNALQREAIAGTGKPVPAPLPLNTQLQAGEEKPAAPQISTGSGRFTNAAALSTPTTAARVANPVSFNFQNQPVQAVVKAVLGDLLSKNYTIAPGVKGNISFATAESLDISQAIPILETLLSWTGNALVQNGQGYVVLPAKGAAAGKLVPGIGAAAPDAGLQARLYPLHYISAPQMQKLIKPFARADAVLLVDAARNLLVMAGTPPELANYTRAVRTFDVDWLRGMSVGVFSLQRAGVDELMPKLASVFGKQGNSPLAGMVRFIPIERTNALVVISTQPDYVTEVGQWIERIDRGGGNQPQLYVYDVRNLKAAELAHYLGQIYAQNTFSGSSGGEVGPGLDAGALGSSGASGATGSDTDANDSGTTGDSSGPFSALAGISKRLGGLAQGGGSGTDSALTGDNPQADSSLQAIGTMIKSNLDNGGSGSSANQPSSSSESGIRISAVDANNQLLVRARPSQWAEIQDVIERLDHVPLQVQIETRILEVNLSGALQFGVQWYLKGLVGSSIDANGNFVTPPLTSNQYGALGQGGPGYGGEPFFYSFLNRDLQVAIRALEVSGHTKTLSAPSMMVLNNQTARIQVGNQVPVNQTSVSGIGSQVFNQVSYLDTGVILTVQPRVNPGGLVYMNIGQQVSQVDISKGLVNGNPTVSQRQLTTQIAVQSGQAVLLGGLIQQDESSVDTGIPGLNQIPVLGRLFGQTSRQKQRTELVVLITPRVIASSEDARQVTNDYQKKFQSLAPLRNQPGARAAERAPAPGAR